MAGHADLSNYEWNCGRNLPSLAERNPVRHLERRGVSARSTASAHQQPIREGLQRGADGREPH